MQYQRNKKSTGIEFRSNSQQIGSLTPIKSAKMIVPKPEPVSDKRPTGVEVRKTTKQMGLLTPIKPGTMVLPKPPSGMMLFPSLPPKPPTMTNITKQNFGEICRCCVVNKGEMNVFEAHFQNKPLRDLIYACTNEKIVADDGLPRTICAVCMQLIISSYTFSNRVKEIQVHIRELQKTFFGQSCGAKSDVNDDNLFMGESEINVSREDSSKRDDFKQKFRGLRKVYNQLMDILEENKKQVKRSVKADSRYYSSLRLEKINNKEDNLGTTQETRVLTSDILENPEPIVSPTKDENVSLTNCNNNVPKEDDLAVSNMLKSESFQLLSDQEIGDKEIQTNDDGMIDNQPIEQIEYPIQMESKNASPTRQNKFFKSETFTEVIDGSSLNFLEVYTMPDHVLGNHFEELVKSSFERFKSFGEGQITHPKLREEGSAGSCFECAKTLYTEKDWIQHCRETGHVMAHRFKCKKCSQTFALRRKWRSHMQAHNTFKSMCEICGALVNSTNLPRHMIVHNSATHHICQFCGKTFTQKGNLADHMRHEHMGMGNKSLCFLCGKSFRTANALNKHLDDKHKDDDLAHKSFSCRLCPRYFVTKKSLDLHVTFGHGDGRMNTRISNKHKTGKGNTTAQKLSKKKYGYKPKPCPICHKLISQPGYKVHMYIHQGIKPYKCMVCNIGFRQPAHLKSHMNLHLDQKPYKCKFCEKRFRHLTTLTTHVRGHTGETPFICPICGKGFTHSTGMKKHQQTHFKKSRRNEQSTSVTVKLESDIQTESDSDE